jgi:hypothetical protein
LGLDFGEGLLGFGVVDRGAEHEAWWGLC